MLKISLLNISQIHVKSGTVLATRQNTGIKVDINEVKDKCMNDPIRL